MESEIIQPSPEKPKKTAKSAARETLFRVTMQNQMRFISIADQKANIIIGINTILISLIIAILGIDAGKIGLHFVSNLDLNLPLSIMLVSCFVSGIVALFVVRPVNRPWRDPSVSRLFFRDFRNTHLEEFITEIGTVLNDTQEIYRSLSTDMYLIGQAVARKYRLLRITYFIFIGGLSLTVLSFFIVRLFG